jgi:outer membrane protein assembly factor BamB
MGCLWAADVPGADWPQFRYDAGRTAASPEGLRPALHLQWVRRLPAPKPAFRAEVRLAFDASYEPVVLGKTMFVPSMVTDTLTALDTETGAERWRFFAEGPVRLPPVAWQGAVYFVSDDGFLYCVDAAEGTLRWKFQGLPPGKTDRKVTGNGRLVSLWPARGGPVLSDGIVYFGVGIWSTYGVAIHALDAATGKVVWSNADSNRIPKANMDHGVANYVGLTPQGCLAVVGGKLVVPCGAQLPAFLDLKTGALETYTMGWGGRDGLPKGTWFVAGVKNYLSHGGDLYDVARPNDEEFPESKGRGDFKPMLYAGAFTRVRIDPTNQKDLGAFGEPVLTPDAMYESDQGVAAYDLTSAKLEERSKSEIPATRRDDAYPDKWKAVFRELWRLPSQRKKAHIKAGEHLYTSGADVGAHVYANGAGVVEAVRIPKSGEEPQAVWHTEVAGTPHRMLAADGKLFVVTREGAIYAFGGQEKADPISHEPPDAPRPPDDAWTKTAANLLQAAEVRDGYALVLGAGTGRLAEELIRQSNLDAIVVEPDARKATELRERLHRAGLYGTRASIHVGDPSSYPLPPYLASLIVSEDWGAAGAAASRSFVEAVYHPLRPYGGTACIAVPPAERDGLVKQVTDSWLPGATARQAGDWVYVSREGPLPGSADWSHAEADAANTGASEDQFVKTPLELLWFDGPPRWIRVPGATMVRISGGRMLLKAEKLQACDIFTGRRLWEATLPFRHNANDQVVATDDAIYVAGGKTCLILDPATGEKSAQIDLPSDLTGAWANLRIWQGFLIAQSGRHLVCFNRRDRKLLWQFECGRPSLSLAVGDGKAFCSELTDPRRGETAGDAKTRALELETGKLLWEIAGGSEVRYSRAADVVVMSSGIYRARDGSLAAALPAAPKTDPPARRENVPKPLFVVGEKLLVGTDERYVVRNLPGGEQAGEAMTWTRRGCTIPRASSQMVTTRYLGNAACIDLASREITPFWNVRAACANNLFPADGVFNMPSLTGGCTCNYLPVSQAYVPASAIGRAAHR